MTKRVTVIGGGIAGMESAGKLAQMGYEVTLLEKANKLGGNVNNWHHLFPDYKPAQEIIKKLKSGIQDKVNILFGAEVYKNVRHNNSYSLLLTDGQKIEADSIVIATGYDLFDARKKEEYGYRIYDNIITSSDLEEKLNNKELKNGKGQVPSKIAFIHCVGSRDEKSGNTYCSKVCCVTGVKQAIEVKKLIPDAEVYNFYMDLRMFDRYFEDMYLEAQTKYNIRFIRGRLSETSENIDGSIVLKAEDTLVGRPIKITVDMVVLLVGFCPSKGSNEIAERLGIELEADRFFKNIDEHLNANATNLPGVFVAGACTGPKSIKDTINDARATVVGVANFLNKK